MEIETLAFKSPETNKARNVSLEEEVVNSAPTSYQFPQSLNFLISWGVRAEHPIPRQSWCDPWIHERVKGWIRPTPCSKITSSITQQIMLCIIVIRYLQCNPVKVALRLDLRKITKLLLLRTWFLLQLPIAGSYESYDNRMDKMACVTSNLYGKKCKYNF